MRPSPKEMLAGMLYTMQHAVIPELSSPYAALQARGVARLLKYLVDSWDSLQPALEEENHRARRLLEEISGFLEEEIPREDSGPAYGAITAALAYPRGRTLKSLNEENLRLRAGLCRALELLGPTLPPGGEGRGIAGRRGKEFKKAIVRLAGDSVEGEMESVRKRNG